MIIFIQNLMNYQEISVFVSVFIFSFILHIVIFFLFNLLNSNVKKNIENLINNNYFFIMYILFVFIFFLYVYTNIIYLDDVVIKTKIDNVEINVTGEAVKQLFYSGGSSAAFVVGVRFASVILQKSNLGPLPKIGVGSITGGGFLLMYKMSQNISDRLKSSNSIDEGITTNTGPINIEITIPNTNNNATDSNLGKDTANKIFELFKIKSDNQTGFTSIKHNYPEIKPKFTTSNVNSVELSEPNKSFDSSQVLKALTEQNPDWQNQFDVTVTSSVVESPLEPESSLFNSVLDQLFNIMTLEYIILYLFLMFLLIIASKFIIKNTTIFNFLNQFLIGRYIFKFINFIITTWKNSSNIWLYYISCVLIFFHIWVIYCLLELLTFLTKLK